MRKGLALFFSMLMFICLMGSAGASVVQYNAGAYSTPDGWDVIATMSPINLDHSYFYEWGIEDLVGSLQPEDTVQIVFRGIYDWTTEYDWLNVYVRDFQSGDSLGWQTGGLDSQSKSVPDWTGWIHLGVWSDPTGGGAQRYDVVYTIEGDALAYLTNNNGGFVLGIDPDCHYFGQKITVEAPAPVPEPATMLLLGAGLVGLAGFGKRKFLR